MASYALGSKWIAPDEVVRALFGGADATSEGIVGGLRASRTALGLLCGAALGAAGVLMQALTRNPVADPGLLGVNAGASLGVVAGIAVLGSVGVTAAIGFALVGAAVATAAVFALATARFAEASPVRLTLAGVAMAAVFSGAAQAIVVLDERVLDAVVLAAPRRGLGIAAAAPEGVRVRHVDLADPSARALIPHLEPLLPAPDRGFAWLAGESALVTDLRRWLVAERGLPKARVQFTGYWRRGVVAGH